MDDLQNCIQKGLLRNIPSSKENAKRSIEIAKKWLIESEKNTKANAINSSIFNSYLAMFHAARSILYLNGWREKSHYCLARYIEFNYVKKNKIEPKWLEMLDDLRDKRYDDQYSLTFITTINESKEILNNAKLFVKRFEKLLNLLIEK